MRSAGRTGTGSSEKERLTPDGEEALGRLPRGRLCELGAADSLDISLEEEGGREQVQGKGTACAKTPIGARTEGLESTGPGSSQRPSQTFKLREAVITQPCPQDYSGSSGGKSGQGDKLQTSQPKPSRAQAEEKGDRVKTYFKS